MSITPIDYDSAKYNIPGDETSDAYQVIKAIEVDTFTEKTIDGLGVFDVLMSTVAAHLKGEYRGSRITGAEYSKIYTAAMEACLSTALQFILGKDQAYWDAVKSQAEAITAKVGLQTAKYQTEAAKEQLDLLKEQYETQRAQTLGTRSDGSPLAGILGSQLTLQDEQLELIKEQVETQRGQTLGTRRDNTPVSGVIGSQVSLYNQQVDSYKRDAETKAGKMFVDAWITQKTMDEGLTPPTNFTNVNLDAILSKIRFNNGLS